MNTTQHPPTGVVDTARSYNTHHGHTSHLPMKPLAVTVTQLVHKETDVELDEQEQTPRKERDEDDDSAMTARLSNKERGSWNAV